MKGTRIFLAWLLTVVMGSLLLPFVVIIFGMFFRSLESTDTEIGFLFLAVLIALMLSAACSLPALIALLVVNYVQKRKQRRKALIFAAVWRTHFIVFLLTILIGSLIISFGSGHAMIDVSVLAYIAVVCWYGVLAAGIWYRMFSKERRAAEKLEEEVLDA